MIIYSTIFVLFYATGAYFSINAIVYHIFFDNQKNFIEIIYLYAILFLLLAGHTLLYRYGQKRQYISKPLIIILCCLDAITFGIFFLIIKFFMLDAGMINYFKTLIWPSIRASAYWLLIAALLHRIWITRQFFNMTD